MTLRSNLLYGLMIFVQFVEQFFVGDHSREDGDEEASADARLTAYAHITTHLFDDALANAQA